MNAVPKPGEFYRHFKNRMYQIIAVAKHSETGEWMVVYQALYDDFGMWVRPLSMFMEEIDRGQYPDAKQRYRFERVSQDRAGETFRTEALEESTVNHLLLEFLDTDSFEDRINLLQRMKGRVGQREVDSLCLSLDAKSSDGTIEEQLEYLQQYLRMQQRYDVSRLRRR